MWFFGLSQKSGQGKGSGDWLQTLITELFSACESHCSRVYAELEPTFGSKLRSFVWGFVLWVLGSELNGIKANIGRLAISQGLESGRCRVRLGIWV